MDVNLFSGFSKKLDFLNDEIKRNIKELIFSYREGQLGVVAVFDTKKIVEDLAGFVLYDELLLSNPNKYFIDLESMDTNKIRLYVNSPYEKEISGYGYYLNEDKKIYEKKVYKKIRQPSSFLEIYRYDVNGNQIGDVEKEIAGDSSIWKGPLNIIELAEQHGYRTIFLKKTAKDRCYLRILKY